MKQAWEEIARVLVDISIAACLDLRRLSWALLAHMAEDEFLLDCADGRLLDARVNQPLTEKEMEAVRRCAHRGQPLDNDFQKNYHTVVALNVRAHSRNPNLARTVL